MYTFTTEAHEVNIMVFFLNFTLRTRSHQVSVSTLRQLCNDARGPVLIENNTVVSEWGCNPFWCNCIVFNHNSITSVIAALSQC